MAVLRLDGFFESFLWERTGGALAARLRVWWYGFDPRATAIEAVPEEEPVVSEVGEEPPVDRLAIAQRIWGSGYLSPGGPAYIDLLIKPFGVNPAMSLLDLSAGLGGPSRHVSQRFDVYITGLERSPDVAKRGNTMSVDAGLGRKVPVTANDPETMELRSHAYDCVYGQYFTWNVADKERLVREVMRSLKARGQFSFVDFVLADGDLEDKRLDRLRTVERYAPLPWRVSQYTDCLNNAGFDVRISEDHSVQFKENVTAAWAQFMVDYEITRMNKQTVLAVLDEGDLWMARLAAIESGVLQVYRFYAISTYGSLM
jgi:SAM-dependent methyltransferase